MDVDAIGSESRLIIWLNIFFSQIFRQRLRHANKRAPLLIGAYTACIDNRYQR